MFLLDAGVASYLLGLTRRIGDNCFYSSNDGDGGNVEGFNNSEIASPAKPTAASRVKESIKTKYPLSNYDLLAIVNAFDDCTSLSVLFAKYL